MTTPISIVIPTHNRAAGLERLLSALADQNVSAGTFDVTLVADGCRDHTVAKAHAQQLPYALRVIETPGVGAAAARNLGAEACEGSLLLFLDDDMEAMPDVVASHLRRHRAAADQVVLGRIEAPGACDPGDFLGIAMRNWWSARFAEIAEPTHQFTFLDLFAGHFSVSRELFERAGRFDPVFDRAAGEDYELAVRLLDCGGRFCFASEASTIHHDHPSVARALARAAAEGRGQVRLLRRHPELYQHFRICEILEGPRRERMWRWVWKRPRLARSAVTALRGALELSRRCRGRRRHRQIFGQLHTWAYWSGVKDELPTLTELRRFVQDLPLGPTHFRETEVDLADGASRVSEQLASADAHAVRLRMNTRPIGRIAPRAGAEPLRWRHLGAMIACRYSGVMVKHDGHLAHPVMRLASYDEHRSATQLHRVQPPRIKLADFDLDAPDDVIWGLEGYGSVLVLVCRGGRPLDILAFDVMPGMHTLPRAMIEAALARGGHQITALNSDELPKPNGMRPVSVVVCTRNRPASLQRCLAALMQLDHPEFEVVVVDNAPSDDRTREVVSATPFRYVRETTPGLDWARNRGVAEASHDLIAYVDDDAVPSRGWLRAIAGAFEDPQVDAVTGLVLPGELVTRAQQLFERYGHGMSKGLRPRVFSGRAMSPQQWLRPQAVGVGANLALRRSAWASVGGFDTALDVGTPSHGAGDLDMIHRLLVAGHTIRYEPSAWMRHQHRRDGAALYQQLQDNGRGFGCFLIKTFVRGEVPRSQTAISVLLWVLWLVNRSIRAVWRKKRLPRSLIWAETIGALQAPYAYLATHRVDRGRRKERARRSGGTGELVFPRSHEVQAEEARPDLETI